MSAGTIVRVLLFVLVFSAIVLVDRFEQRTMGWTHLIDLIPCLVPGQLNRVCVCGCVCIAGGWPPAVNTDSCERASTVDGFVRERKKTQTSDALSIGTCDNYIFIKCPSVTPTGRRACEWSLSLEIRIFRYFCFHY